MELIGQIAILFGAITFATAGLGLIRFPDVYTRASAVSTAAGLGIVFVVFGALLIQPTVTDAIKAVILVILQLATAAIGSATIARAAYITGVKMKRKYFNELADGEDD
jgi:multicomponent Na+:H+ antiporter subunit G